MRRNLVGLVCIVFLAIGSRLEAGNSDRAGEAGAYELLINGQARCMGLMGINSANVRGIDALGSNIAGLAYNKKLSVFGNYLSWLSGTETQLIGVGVGSEISPGNNIGFNINYMSFGKMELTTTESNTPIGFFAPYMINIGLSYARVFGRGIRGGITGRLVNEGINNLSATGFSLDAGLQYTTGDKEDFHFGVFIRNLGFPMSFSGDGLLIKSKTPGGTDLPFYQRAAKFELPTQFSIALSKDLYFGKKPESSIFCKPMHRVSVSTNFVYNAFIENNFGLGVEYAFREQFALRAGYVYETNGLNKENTTRAHMGIAAGVSYDLKMGKKDEKNPSVLEVSYNYRPTWVFNGTHNIGFTYFTSKYSYCDELVIEKKAKEVVEVVKESVKEKEKVKEKAPEPEIRYITKYDTIYKQAPAKIETVVEYNKVNDILKSFAGNIEFKSGTAILTERGEGALSVIGDLMRQYPQSRFKIIGHTDGDGSNENNMRLSKLRSKTVARYLTEFKGIPENSMLVEWFGEEKPISDNDTENGRQRNRRVEISVLDGKLEEISKTTKVATEVKTAAAPVKVVEKKEVVAEKKAEVEIEVKKTPQEEITELASTIRYKTGTDSLARGSKRSVSKLAALLKANPSLKIKIEAHTDNTKYTISNMELSINRAKAILEQLKAEGIDASRVTFEGFGDTKALDTNETETGKEKNRRIDIKIVN